MTQQYYGSDTNIDHTDLHTPNTPLHVMEEGNWDVCI